MKTLFPLLALSIAGAAVAARSPTPPARQDVGRLVLLPGPHLTSPSKYSPLIFSDPGSVTIAPVSASGQDRSSLRFQSGSFSGSTSVTPSRNSAERHVEFAPAVKPQVPQDAASLRFDAKLTPTTPQRTPVPAPKPVAPAESEPKRD